MRPFHDFNQDDPFFAPPPRPPPAIEEPPTPAQEEALWKQVKGSPAGVQKNSRTGRWRHLHPDGMRL